MKKQVYAISLLLAFLVMLSHEMVPHRHVGVVSNKSHSVEHDQKDHSHNHHSHNHSDSHKHSHDKEKDQHEHGFLLSFPLKQHVHSFHTHTFVQVRSNTPQLSGNQTFSLDAIQTDHSLNLQALYPLIHHFTIQQSSNSDPPCLTSYTLRGPPRMG